MAEDSSVNSETVANTHVNHSAKDKGTFVPLIFGGAVATALGFFVGQIDAVERVLGIEPPANPLEQVVAAQAEKIDEQSAQIAALLAQVDSLPKEIPEVDLSGIEGEIAQQTEALDAVTARLTALEKRPMTDAVSREAIAAYEGELAGLQASVQAQRAEIEALLDETRGSQSDAERRAKLALARAAMARMIAAINSGEPYADALAELESSTDVSVPDAISANADSGVATLAAVQQDIDDVVRAALSAVRKEEAASGNGGGLGSFLKRQLGARSTVPLEGDSPEAVLSRVEAAVRQGQLSQALSEADALPEVARTAMADWITQAKTRDTTVSAADELMSALSAN